MSGDSLIGQGDLFQQVDGGSIPTSPLHPKQLVVKKISRLEAKQIWMNKHYMHRDVPGASIELGIFGGDELVGACCFSAWVVWAPKGGRPHTWELRRFWLDDRCQKNSESRIIRICARMVKGIAPHVLKIIAYADPGAGHRGTIYSAAGFRQQKDAGLSDGNAYGNTKEISKTAKRVWILDMINIRPLSLNFRLDKNSG